MAELNLEQLQLELTAFHGINDSRALKAQLEKVLLPYFSFKEFCLINFEDSKASLEMRTIKYIEFDETILKSKLQQAQSQWLFNEDNSLFYSNEFVNNLIFHVDISEHTTQCLVFFDIKEQASFNDKSQTAIKILLQQVAVQLAAQTRLNRQKFHSTSLLTRLGELSELFRDFASEWFWRTNKDEHFINVLTTASHSNLYKRHFLHKNFDAIITEQEQNQLKKWSHFKHLLAEHAEFLDFEFEVNSSPPAWVSLSGKPQFDSSGKFRGYLGIAKDITVNKDREQALQLAKEKAEEANQAKSQFLTVMSHEIRTPMNAIVGMLELLADSELNDKQTRWLDYANSSADLLLDLISDVLDFSKIESGSMELDVKATDINALVKNITAQFQETTQGSNVLFTTEISDGLPNKINIDGVRVGQILFNILDNAFKFTKVGTVNFRADFNDTHLLFEIADTGQGISQSQIASIYDAFKQHDYGVNRQVEGIGLGLSITKSLVDLMKGEIRVASAINIGTKFNIYIPYSIVADDQQSIEHEQTLEPMAILVTEDNKTNQVLIKTFLEKLNHHVTLADNGQQAIDKVQQQNFDLVLMDMMMPVMDGITATKYMREELKMTLPIVALTANASHQDKATCLEAGMNKVLTKPIRFHDLNRALRILFSQ
ncbi:MULTISPECIES: response regulator [unclassified Pseudoalteromonas]|uniref:response regulator n=1 Tax=unclassified Pseudoalteromonas TaxID=194690 RepID=UPI0006CA0761|nr:MULTISPECIES: response regulator [unclassified Pseudoalteromonas]KPZ72080.1 Autoinducer 2 sensor kinase/phosphatase LuxQ [Pseudoalteromonas sp. P1-26]NRA81265.1 response regulator [Pseudoalteromonas sp.]